MKRKIEFQSFDRPEFWVGDYVKFASELGYVSWTWNALHADLCDLFWEITGISSPDIPRAIWHSAKSDSGQREMLRAAARARLTKDSECLSELLWLLGEVDQLAAFRNDAFHTLWTVHREIVRDPTPEDYRKLATAVPDLDRGNPRGARLQGKPAGEVFKALCGHCMTLVQFARALGLRVQGWDNGEPLPERPMRPSVLLPNQRD